MTNAHLCLVHEHKDDEVDLEKTNGMAKYSLAQHIVTGFRCPNELVKTFFPFFLLLVTAI